MQQLYVLLSLGSNLGDRLAYLQAATNALKQFPNGYITAASAVYESPPWGIDGTPAYLNAALLLTINIPVFNIYSAMNNTLNDTVNNIANIDTDIDINTDNIKKLLNTLLSYCQLIEKNYHRVRIKNKQYAARTLDIDILYAELSNGYYKNNENHKNDSQYNYYYSNIIKIDTINLIIPHTQFTVRAFALKPALDIWYSQTSRNRLLYWYNQPNIQIDEKKIIKIKSIIYI
jgi:7,8-dihydro-6-hydroxymethylpterin-pyrophosphokinase